MSHLPPTITFVGELEPFKDETIEYVEALKANIPVKFALFPKAFHAFEQLVKHADVAKKANAFHLEAWGAFYDLYLINRSDIVARTNPIATYKDYTLKAVIVAPELLNSRLIAQDLNLSEKKINTIFTFK